MKVALVGAHGSGKSTIISAVYSELKKRNIRVNMSQEVARESLFLAAKENTPKKQMDLFGRQISMEMTCSRNCDMLLCDRSVFDILMYTRLFFPNDEEAKSYAKSMEKFCEDYKKSYSQFFVTTKMYSPTQTQDDIRPSEHSLQEQADIQLRRTLDEFEIKYILLGKNPVEEIVNILSK